MKLNFLPFYTCDERWALYVVIKQKFFLTFIDQKSASITHRAVKFARVTKCNDFSVIFF